MFPVMLLLLQDIPLLLNTAGTCLNCPAAASSSPPAATAARLRVQKHWEQGVIVKPRSVIKKHPVYCLPSHRASSDPSWQCWLLPKDDDINYDENLIDAVTNLNTFVDEENEDTDEIVDISLPGNIDELSTFDHLHLPHQDSQ